MRQLKRYEQRITGRENETIVCFIVFLVFPEGLNPLDHIVKTVRCRKLLQNTCSGERVPNTNARNLFLGAIVFFVLFFSLAHFSLLFALVELKYVICSILELKSRYLQHFGAKLVFRWYLQHFGPWTSSCQKKRSILEPAFARYCLHHVYSKLKSHIRMVFVSFWCNNMEFAWYLLQMKPGPTVI